MSFQIIRQDITQMDTDAIVNAANTNLLPGGGVCGAIYESAGYEKLDRACRAIGRCETGSAVITNGFNLKARYIIHTAGPVYDECDPESAGLLYSCYRSSLELAAKKGLGSIAFPLISSGRYGYPARDALKIANSAIADFLEHNDMEIYLVVYDRVSFGAGIELFDDVKAFIDSKNEKLREMELRNDSIRRYQSASRANRIPPNGGYSDLDTMLSRLDSSFAEYLLTLIDKSGMTDAQVYKKANIDRKHFSKIRSNPNYKPSKITAVAFAVALELDMRSTRELVARAGFSMTHSSRFDIIIEYFISRHNYNVFEINEILFAFDQPLIGA